MKTLSDIIQKILKNGSYLLLIIAGLYILFLRECRTGKIPKNKMLIEKSVWDSIQNIAHKPPKIQIDTFIPPQKIVYLPAKPLPKPIPEKDTTINDYKDSLVTKDINVHVADKIQGTLLDRKWYYTPISREIIKTVTQYVPQIVNNPVPVSKAGLYPYATIGGNQNAFLFGGGFDYITKKNTEYGFIYQRYGSINFYSVKLGAKLTFKR
jgi:hypothetical protein